MMIPLIVLSVAVAMMAIESAAPGRSWPQVACWRLRALIYNSIQAAMVWLAGVAWDGWMMRSRPWSADGRRRPPGRGFPLCAARRRGLPRRSD